MYEGTTFAWITNAIRQNYSLSFEMLLADSVGGTASELNEYPVFRLLNDPN